MFVFILGKVAHALVGGGKCIGSCERKERMISKTLTLWHV